MGLAFTAYQEQSYLDLQSQCASWSIYNDGGASIGAHLVGWLADINVPGHLVASTPASRFDFWLQKRLIPRLDGIVAITDKIISDFAPGKPYILVEGGVAEQVLEMTGPLFREPCDDNFTITSAAASTR